MNKAQYLRQLNEFMGLGRECYNELCQALGQRKATATLLAAAMIARESTRALETARGNGEEFEENWESLTALLNAWAEKNREEWEADARKFLTQAERN